MIQKNYFVQEEFRKHSELGGAGGVIALNAKGNDTMR